jgi:7,8-dihydroneopterin aldolase/epimerase/oxygenase
MNGERIIAIQGLGVSAHAGVSDEERAVSQRLLVDLRFAAATQPDDLNDDIARTVDYHAVSTRVAEISAERPRKLIETLAEDLAAALLAQYRLRWIEVTVRKFILPQTEWVAVSVRRGALER